MSKLCAFCPHLGSVHEDRYDQCWCTECREPCSSYFIGVHAFVPSSHELRGPHGTYRADDCRICGLATDHAGHEVAA